MESWLVDHLVLEGGPGDPACWQRLTDLLGRTWVRFEIESNPLPICTRPQVLRSARRT